MGWLGLGVTQGDQFDDIYRGFMDEYDNGAEIDAITKKIIDEHRAV